MSSINCRASFFSLYLHESKFSAQPRLILKHGAFLALGRDNLGLTRRLQLENRVGNFLINLNNGIFR